MTPDKVPDARLLPVVVEGAVGASGVAGVQDVSQPLPQVKVHEMPAQVKPGKVPVIANPTLGKLFVLFQLLLHS